MFDDCKVKEDRHISKRDKEIREDLVGSGSL
jgi:hypothetical protein